MPDISKITLPSGNTYNLKDSSAIKGVKENGTALTPDANKVVDVNVPITSAHIHSGTSGYISGGQLLLDVETTETSPYNEYELITSAWWLNAVTEGNYPSNTIIIVLGSGNSCSTMVTPVMLTASNPLRNPILNLIIQVDDGNQLTDRYGQLNYGSTDGTSWYMNMYDIHQTSSDAYPILTVYRMTAANQDAVFSGTYTTTEIKPTSSTYDATSGLPMSGLAVASAIADAQVGAASFQGTVASQSTITNSNYKKGWYWVVSTAGTYVGQSCEVGDFIFAIADKGSAYSANDFNVVQANIDMSIFGDLAFEDTASGTYTPAGSVSAPTISVSTSGSTTTIKNPTKETVVKTVDAVAPGQTAPANAITYYSVSGEVLTLYQIGYSTGDSITTSDVTVKTGDASYTATQPSFTGTQATITVTAPGS